MFEYVFAHKIGEFVKFGWTKDIDARQRYKMNGKSYTCEIIQVLKVEEGRGYETYSRAIGTAFDKHVEKGLFRLNVDEIEDTFKKVQNQLDFNKKIIDKDWSERIMVNNVTKESYLQKYYNYISKAELEGRKVKGPQHLPYNIVPDQNVYLTKAALQEKFNRHFTDDEVLNLLQDEFDYKKYEDVSLPQWYIDKWLTK